MDEIALFKPRNCETTGITYRRRACGREQYNDGRHPVFQLNRGSGLCARLQRERPQDVENKRRYHPKRDRSEKDGDVD